MSKKQVSISAASTNDVDVVFMMSPYLMDREALSFWGDDIEELNEVYGGRVAILSCADMQIGTPQWNRPWLTNWCRGKRKVTPGSGLAYRVAETQEMGVKVCPITSQVGWGNRHGYGAYIGSMRENINEAQASTPERTEWYCEFMTDFITKCRALGQEPWGIMPSLESTKGNATPSAVMLKTVIQFIRRDLSYNGHVLVNGPKYNKGFRTNYRVEEAHSINAFGDFMTSSQDFPNSDGMQVNGKSINAKNHSSLIKKMINKPGKKVIWTLDLSSLPDRTRLAPVYFGR